MLSSDFTTKIEQEIARFSGVVRDDETLEGYLIFRLDPKENSSMIENINELNFAIIKLNSRPLVMELSCDRNLSKLLRDKYESVLPAKLMDPRKWIRVIGSGAPTETEIIDLVRLSYNLVKEDASQALDF